MTTREERIEAQTMFLMRLKGQMNNHYATLFNAVKKGLTISYVDIKKIHDHARQLEASYRTVGKSTKNPEFIEEADKIKEFLTGIEEENFINGRYRKEISKDLKKGYAGLKGVRRLY